MREFKLGSNDINSKPIEISERLLHKESRITGKTIEKLTLFRILPLIIGNHVPESN